MSQIAQTFTHRLASFEDEANIKTLMLAAISENMAEFLSATQIEAAKESMGLDRSLIRDQTYFVIEAQVENQTVIVGCGGWGKRKTLFGGDQTPGRDDSLSNPKADAARIRAMYTHPQWIRKGVGSLLLTLGENAARQAGFTSIELGSTIPGLPLYEARGYKEVERIVNTAKNGMKDTIIRMSKPL